MHHYQLDLELERQLRHWGQWCNDVVTWGLGYSHQNILEKVQHGKGVVIHDTTQKLAPENSEADIINDIVNLLGQEAPLAGKVIYIHYTTKGNTRKKAGKLSIPQSSYIKHLTYARKFTEARWRALS